MDDDREIRARAAAALEFAEDRVVVLDQRQVDVGREILGFFSARVPPPAHERDDTFDELTVAKKEIFSVPGRQRDLHMVGMPVADYSVRAGV